MRFDVEVINEKMECVDIVNIEAQYDVVALLKAESIFIKYSNDYVFESSTMYINAPIRNLVVKNIKTGENECFKLTAKERK